MWGVFWRDFWKIFKNDDFGFDIFEKGQILRPFSGLAPSKLKIFPGVGYVCTVQKGIVWYHFQYGLWPRGLKTVLLQSFSKAQEVMFRSEIWKISSYYEFKFFMLFIFYVKWIHVRISHYFLSPCGITKLVWLFVIIPPTHLMFKKTCNITKGYFTVAYTSSMTIL